MLKCSYLSKRSKHVFNAFVLPYIPRRRTKHPWYPCSRHHSKAHITLSCHYTYTGHMEKTSQDILFWEFWILYQDIIHKYLKLADMSDFPLNVWRWHFKFTFWTESFTLKLSLLVSHDWYQIWYLMNCQLTKFHFMSTIKCNIKYELPLHASYQTLFHWNPH